LRKKNGVLKPVTPRGTLSTLSHTYDIIFVHNTPSGTENWIGVVHNQAKTKSSIYTTIKGTRVQIGTTDQFPLINAFTQIGNVVNVTNSAGLMYLIWYDTEYKVISSDIDVRVDLKADGVSSNGNPKTRRIDSEDTFSYSNDDDAILARPIRADYCKGLSDKLLYSLKKDGLISGFILACTAIELYDGSYILQSNPVLLGQANDAHARYTGLVINGVTTNYISPKAIVDPIYADSVTNDDETIDAETTTQSFVNFSTDMIASEVTTLPNLLATWNHAGVAPTKISITSGYNQLKFKLDNLIDPKYTPIIKSISVFVTKEVSQYKDSNTDNYSFIGAARVIESESFNQDVENYLPVVKTDAEIIEELKTNQIFYKIHEIPFEDIVISSASATPVTAGQWVAMDIKGKLGDNLINQDTLPIDNFTHHTLVPNGQMVYNSKLHVWDYKQTLFKGWILPELYAQQGVGQFAATGSTNEVEKSYSVVNIKTQTGISKVVTELDKFDWESLLFNPILSYPDSRATEITLYRGLGHKDLHECTVKNELSVTPLPNVSENIIITAQSNVLVNVILEIIVIFHTGVDTFSSVTKTVTIPINTNTKTINVSEIEGITGDIEVIEINALTTQNDNINTYYSYFSGGLEVEGDKTTTLYDITIDTAQKKKFKLIPSESNNFAYYISTDLKPIALDSTIIENTIPTEQNIELIYRNVLKVSAVNNPFYFPATQTHPIGTGFIRNLATNAIQMSEGQFGQYPLYVFTSEGIYSLDTGTTIAYNSQSPASTEIPISNIVCPVTRGVIFIGNRGLFIIIGQDPILLTPQLEQEPSPYSVEIPLISVIPTIAVESWNDSFREYLKTVTEIAYDSQNNEIIIINSSEGYNFVLNLDSKEIYQSTEVIKKTVQNVYPALYAVNGLVVKDYSLAKTTTEGETTTTDKASVSILTRPFNFGTPDIKKLDRLILRARLIGAEDLVVMNHYSNDGINFAIAQGKTFTDGNYKDVDLGLMARNKHRQFMFAMSAKLDEQSEISILEAQVAAEYTNDKMR
jgi:hypothetical protein